VTVDDLEGPLKVIGTIWVIFHQQ